ncbi:SRPBCC family protein [Dongia sp.]|uniref:SRPBCC family protein n=1 Tax=Dongia sp. TaxID=1977262 RepID=UPI0035B41D6E
MRRHSYETTSDLPPERLYKALADIASWPQWDDGIEAIVLDGPAESGAVFALKPRGRQAVKLRVETMVEPYRFADMAYLPLARMRTEHSFIPTPDGTLVRSTVEISGPLARFWDRTLTRDYREGAARQTRRFLAFAANWNGPAVAPAPVKRALPFYTVC